MSSRALSFDDSRRVSRRATTTTPTPDDDVNDFPSVRCRSRRVLFFSRSKLVVVYVVYVKKERDDQGDSRRRDGWVGDIRRRESGTPKGNWGKESAFVVANHRKLSERVQKQF